MRGIRVMLALMLGGVPAVVLGQQTERPKSPPPIKAKAQNPADKGEKKKPAKQIVVPEFELGEIIIEAVVERPNVDIFPKRIKVDMEEIAFIDRTFEHEIKEIPKNLLLYDEELDSAKRLTRLRAILKKRQKKLKK